jgi:structural maintenance of chromosomes protein 5
VLADSRQKVFGVSPELRAEYEVIEQTRTEYERACKVAEEEGKTPPDAKDVELRSTEELQAELETQEANLAMNLNTNPGVVEQYEKRKKEVSNQPCYLVLVLKMAPVHQIEALTDSLESQEKKSHKIERAIKNARVYLPLSSSTTIH